MINKIINLIVHLLGFTAIIEIIALTYGIGIPILTNETSSLVHNLAYSYFGGYFFYLLVVFIPEKYRLKNQIQIAFYPVFQILNNMDELERISGNDENDQYYNDLRMVILRIQSLYIKVIQYFDTIDSELLLKIDSLIHKVNRVMYNPQIKIEGGNHRYNSKLIKEIILESEIIKKSASKELALIKKRFEFKNNFSPRPPGVRRKEEKQSDVGAKNST
jgi:hypothetical protein